MMAATAQVLRKRAAVAVVRAAQAKMAAQGRADAAALAYKALSREQPYGGPLVLLVVVPAFPLLLKMVALTIV